MCAWVYTFSLVSITANESRCNSMIGGGGHITVIVSLAWFRYSTDRFTFKLSTFIPLLLLPLLPVFLGSLAVIAVVLFEVRAVVRTR